MQVTQISHNKIVKRTVPAPEQPFSGKKQGFRCSLWNTAGF